MILGDPRSSVVRAMRARTIAAWLIPILFVGAGISQAQEPSDPTFERLAKVNQFAFEESVLPELFHRGKRTMK
jgi:hypothetical protein